MDTVKVRNVVIGEGIPKICVPVFERTKEEILKEAENIASIGPDIVEFRADRFEYYSDPARLADVLAALREALGDIPLLFTLRTLSEGGEADIDGDGYADILEAACGSGLIDIVDVEAPGSYDAGRVIDAAHAEGVKVIASHHDFEKTPSGDEITDILSAMRSAGADILKIAVMPHDHEDVMRLLLTTREMSESADRPIVAISMSEIGTISRVAGEAFGSAITFGAASKASAPGQIGAEELRKALEEFHEDLVSEAATTEREK